MACGGWRFVLWSGDFGCKLLNTGRRYFSGFCERGPRVSRPVGKRRMSSLTFGMRLTVGKVRLSNNGVVVFSCLAVCAAAAPHTGRFLWERVHLSSQAVGVLVDKREFSDQSLIAHSDPLIATKYRFFKQVMFTDPAQDYYQRQPSHGAFRLALFEYNRGAKLEWQAGELVVTPRGAILRIRDRLQVRRVVLDGQDPLQFSINGSTFDILHIDTAFHRVHVFGYSPDPLMASTAEVLFQHFREVFPEGVLSMSLRNDRWFVDAGFPSYFMFSTEPPPPEEQWQRRARIECSTRRSGNPCIAWKETTEPAKL